MNAFENVLDSGNMIDSENVFNCGNVSENVLDCVNMSVGIERYPPPIIVPLDTRSGPNSVLLYELWS